MPVSWQRACRFLSLPADYFGIKWDPCSAKVTSAEFMLIRVAYLIIELIFRGPAIVVILHGYMVPASWSDRTMKQGDDDKARTTRVERS